MGFETIVHESGVAEVIMANPPVNALTVAGWFEGRIPEVGALVLRAEGKGFNAGVDIKEMQNTEGFDALLGANRGCYAAFAAVYECEVPVVCAVQDFCLGGGIGLVGNADVIVAAEGTREMVYTAEPVDASVLLAFGSVARVVPKEDLRSAAMEVAEKICTKSRFVIRRAKECLNAIDPVDVKRSYRFEQGFTFELNLSGVSDEARDAFVSRTDAKFTK